MSQYVSKSISGRSIKHPFELLGIIGEGTYGVIYKCRVKETGDFVALKRSKVPRVPPGQESSDTPNIRIDLIREIKLLRELGQMEDTESKKLKGRIVELMDVYVDEKHKLNLMYRYVELDLAEIISYHRDHNKQIDFTVIKSVVLQLLEGVKFLHDNWIMHRDLKPSNILVARGNAPKDPGQVKIADFGMSRLFQDPFVPFNHVDAVVVTSWYRAPELLLDTKHYTCSIDIWAVGCIFAEMVTRKPVFHAKETDEKFHREQVEKVFTELGPPSRSEWPELHDLPKWKDAETLVRSHTSHSASRLSQQLQKGQLPEKGMDLVMQCLQYNPNNRLSAAEALDHDYFKEEPLPLDENIWGKQNSDIYPQRKLKPLDENDANPAANNTGSMSNKRPPPGRKPAPPPHKVQRRQ